MCGSDPCWTIPGVVPDVAADHHICHVFPNFCPGGSQIRTSLVINGLGNGYRHTVIAIDDDWEARSRIDESIQIDYVNSEHGRWGRLYPLFLGRKLRKLRPDLLLVYNWGAMDAGIGAVLRRVRPWIAVLDGFDASEAERQHPRRLFLRRIFYRRARGIVVVSRRMQEIAVRQWRIPSERVMHVPNGLDTERFAPGSGDEVRAQLGLTQADLLVGSVAHLRAEKKPARLLAAFSRVASKYPRAHLMFVGDLPVSGDRVNRSGYDEVLAGIASMGLEGRVHFTGIVEDTVPYYRALDIFALSSETEQMPLSVMEAMACGKPVVSTDVGDVRWMVSEPNRARVVDQADREGYAGALAALLGDAGLRDEAGRANRERACTRFSLARMIAAYEELCERFCAG